MRKSFLYMMRKNICSICLVLLIIAGMTLIGASMTAKLKASPDTTIMYVTPAAIDTEGIEPGETFMINVSVADVTTGMLGYWFNLGFDNTIILPTQVIPRNSTETPPGVNPPDVVLGPLQNISGKMTWTPLQYASQGYVYVIAYWGVSPPFTGSGTAMTINFTALAPGNSTLHLYDTYLGDTAGNEIPHITSDGWANVVPEFPATTIAPLLMITTLTAALLGKIVWSRKRRCPAVA